MRLIGEKIPETGSRRRNGNSLEERTPFHGGSLKCGQREAAKG
jgi:hypothetical protein